MTEKEQAIVRRAFDRAVEIANNGNYPDTHDKLCAFFGSMSWQAGRAEVGLDVFKPKAGERP